MAILNLEPHYFENFNKTTTNCTTRSSVAIKPTTKTTSFGDKQVSKISGLDSLRLRLLERGISEIASQFLSNKEVSGTLTFNSSWAKWVGCVVQGKLIHFSVI